MKIGIQLLCFLVSFLYGGFIFLIEKYHDNLNINYLSRVIISLLYTFILVILYVDIIYFINGGIFHIYFGILMVIGYVVSRGCVKHRKRNRKN